MCKPKSYGGLGFKDLCKFNEAMLAKHIWRLIHDTDSLFYKVFKAKYFPNGNVFEAKSTTGSFAWKSILRSKNLIERNGHWRMGVVKVFGFSKMLGYQILMQAESYSTEVFFLRLLQ